MSSSSISRQVKLTRQQHRKHVMNNNTFEMGTGQAHELALAFGRNGWNNAEVKKLSEKDLLAQVRLVVLGQAKIEIVKHVIDLDADPYLPDGWKVEEHKKGGQFEWDPSKINLYLSPNQLGDKRIEGNDLRKELAKKPVFNANLLDYLKANTSLIPDEWKKDEKGNTRYIFFWGTIYRNSGGGLYVRYLYWGGGEWVWDCYWLGDDWNYVNPAASLAE